MPDLRYAPLTALLFLATWLGALPAAAQDDEEGGNRPAVGARTAPRGSASEPAPPDDLAVRVVLESQPKSPRELIEAGKLLLDLDRPDLARTLLENLSRQKPSDEQWAQLTAKLGTAALLSLAGDERIAPLGGELADAALAATSRYYRDPGRIAAWVKQLAATAEAERAEAAASLLLSGAWAAAPIVQAAAGGNAGALAFSQRFELEEGPLLALLESPETKVQAIATAALARGSRGAIASLLVPATSDDAPTRAEAAAAVRALLGRVPARRAARAMLEDALAEALGRARQTARDKTLENIWLWDAAAGTATPVELRASDAQMQRAAAIAEQLRRLTPDDRAARVRADALALEMAKRRGGYHRPLSGATNPNANAADLERILAYALEHDLSGAAAAAAEMIRACGAAPVASTTGTTSSPLAAAIAHPDRRVRLPALLAIVEGQGAASFVGAGGVAEALGYFVASAGRRRALVVCPRLEDSSRLVGLLATCGYQARACSDGRELLREAASPDCELIFIHAALESPTAESLLVRLRRDPRTALLPVGLVAHSGAPEVAERWAALAARRGGRVLALAMPQDAAGIGAAVEQLEALADRDGTTPAERLAQAALAVDHIEVLAQDSATRPLVQPLAPVLEQALLVRSLAAKAISALASLDSRGGQVRLVELANSSARQLPVRQAAAAAFCRNVAQYGLRLDRRGVLAQYDRYNASADEDRAVQQLLGSILDAIEWRDKSVQN